MTGRELEDLLAEFGAMIRRELRAEFRREMLSLRAEVADLVAEETWQRIEAVKSFQRDLDELTTLTKDRV